MRFVSPFSCLYELIFNRNKMTQVPLPTAFVERMRRLLGDDYDAFELALQETPSVSLRLNPLKPIVFAGDEIAAADEIVPWCALGRYLRERPAFTFDPLLHAGTYYVQEAASMFVEQVVRRYVASKVVALDLCAAPGGKSTHLLSVLPEGSLLVSNETIRSRSRILGENIAKWGATNCVVTCADPKEFGQMTHGFDLIVADLPCSGEGMFRKAPAARAEWSVDNVRLCAARQRRIVHDVWHALRPGGLFVYCTCTFNTEENEENLRYLADTFGAEVLPVDVPETWGISAAMGGELPVSRFFPHRARGEGFCLAVLRKRDDEARAVRKKSRRRPTNMTTPEEMKEWIVSAEEYVFEAAKGGGVRAVPKAFHETVTALEEHVQVLAAGVSVGEVKGKDVVPSAALALSAALRREAFKKVELSLDEALRYLRRETLTLQVDVPRGFVLATYRNVPLGFLKHLGTRANNLFPDEWRIRTATPR